VHPFEFLLRLSGSGMEEKAQKQNEQR